MDANVEKISIEIEKLKSSIERLEDVRQDFPALDLNLKRIMAGVKMLELNFVDPLEEGPG